MDLPWALASRSLAPRGVEFSMQLQLMRSCFPAKTEPYIAGITAHSFKRRLYLCATCEDLLLHSNSQFSLYANYANCCARRLLANWLYNLILSVSSDA
jgi:hypothetical protein